MNCRCSLVLWACSLLVAPELFAQVDQDHWTDSNLIISDNVLYGIQQEFTPALDTMDSVEIKVGMGIIDPSFPNDGLLAVNVRVGGVDGPILAASAPAYLPPLFRGDVLLKFPDAVHLIPGHLYVLEPFSLAPGKSWAINANQPGFGGIPDYSGGRMFFNGQFVGGDMIFREGIGIPEPAPGPLLVIGVAAVCAALKVRRGDRRTPGRRFDWAGRSRRLSTYSRPIDGCPTHTVTSNGARLAPLARDC